MDRPIFIEQDLRTFAVKARTSPKNFASINNQRYYVALCYIMHLEDRLGIHPLDPNKSPEVAPVVVPPKLDPAGAPNPKLPAGVPKKK